MILGGCQKQNSVHAISRLAKFNKQFVFILMYVCYWLLSTFQESIIIPRSPKNCRNDTLQSFHDLSSSLQKDNANCLVNTSIPFLA